VHDKRKRLEASHVTEVTALRLKFVAASELGLLRYQDPWLQNEAASQPLSYMMDERDNLQA
jgi:hypothetical protein